MDRSKVRLAVKTSDIAAACGVKTNTVRRWYSVGTLNHSGDPVRDLTELAEFLTSYKNTQRRSSESYCSE